MSVPRLIKKYRNRRLYDTARCRYITLTDIRNLVDEHVDFVIHEHSTNTDVTCQVLLQVLAHPEESDLTREALARLIRARKAGR